MLPLATWQMLISYTGCDIVHHKLAIIIRICVCVAVTLLSLYVTLKHASDVRCIECRL